ISHLLFGRPPPPPAATLFPYTTLFRSQRRPRDRRRRRRQGRTSRTLRAAPGWEEPVRRPSRAQVRGGPRCRRRGLVPPSQVLLRSEEHTSELQSLAYLVCRLLLEKKKM